MHGKQRFLKASPTNKRRNAMKVFCKFLLCVWATVFLCLPASAQENNDSFFVPAPLKISFPEQDSIIVSYYVGDQDAQDLEIRILIPSKNAYREIYVDSVGPEGASPAKIESIFFKDVDGIPGDEMFVLFSWKINVDQTEGIFYRVCIYTKNSINNGGLIRLESLENKLGMGIEGVVENKPSHAPYINAGDVFKKLKNLTR